MSLHPCFRRRWFMQVCLGKLSHRSMHLWRSVFFCGCASNAQDSPKASPRVLYNWKNFIDQLQLLLKFMNAEWKVAKAQNADFNVPTCGKIAVWQLCRETQPLSNSHDGLNLKCLDQCHGVRSHGTSSSQGRRKRIVVQPSKFDRCVSILVFAEGDLCRFAQEGLPTEASLVDISVFLWLRKQRPRFAQGQPKGCFQLKELHSRATYFTQTPKKNIKNQDFGTVIWQCWAE